MAGFHSRSSCGISSWRMRLRANFSTGGKGSPNIEIDDSNPEKDPMQFTREADHFSECVLRNQTPRTPGEEGLRDMEYIEKIYASAPS